MPRREVIWICKVCGTRFRALDGSPESDEFLRREAEACEAKGEAPDVPVGAISRDGPWSHDMAILSILAAPSSVWQPNRHYRHGSWAAFRDTIAGEPHRAGDGYEYPNLTTGRTWDRASSWPSASEIDRSSARYARAWAWAQKEGVTLSTAEPTGNPENPWKWIPMGPPVSKEDA